MSAPQAIQLCPFCGGSDIHLEELDDTAIASCAHCLAVGPVTAEQSRAEAWRRWNERRQACCSNHGEAP